MIIFLNGKLVPEEQAMVSALDRGFLYGDGLFETVRVANGRLFRWDQHLERLQRGAAFLRLHLPAQPEAIQAAALQLLQENATREGMLRITISRGVGQRGYSPRGASQPTWAMSVHPLPVPSGQELLRWRLSTTRFGVHPGEAISQYKTCNKLAQVLARAEAEEAGADEGLLLTPDGRIAEATSGNVFWIRKGLVETPALEQGVLPGITRSLILELCQKLGLTTAEALLTPEAMLEVEGAFVSLASWGMVEASHLNGRELASSSVTQQLWSAYQELVREETR